MPLTDKQIRSLKHTGTDKIRQLHADGHGLYLSISPTGNKSWIIKYRFEKKQKNYTIGKYPQITLADARSNLYEIKKILSNGIDPAEHKKESKQNPNENLFKNVAHNWFNTFNTSWTPKYANQVIMRLENHIFPDLGNRSVASITAKDILNTVRKMEAKGIGETTVKTLQHIRSILDYAVIETFIEFNPANRLSNNLKPVKTENLPALPQNQIKDFFKDLILTGAELPTKCALLLAMLTATRMGTLRVAKWNNFDIEQKLWNIPAEDMKQNRPFTVTLSPWCITILEQLKQITGNSTYLFPSLSRRGNKHPYMSENTVGKLIFKMGYDGKHEKPKVVPHGFRSLFTDVCNENGFNPDAIERALDHLEKNMTRRAYLRSDFIDDRFKIANWYSNWLKTAYESAWDEILHELKDRNNNELTIMSLVNIAT